MMESPEAFLTADSIECARLLGIIADALTAMDNRLYGDARKILTKGKTVPLMAITGVLTKGDAA